MRNTNRKLQHAAVAFIFLFALVPWPFAAGCGDGDESHESTDTGMEGEDVECVLDDCREWCVFLGFETGGCPEGGSCDCSGGTSDADVDTDADSDACQAPVSGVPEWGTPCHENGDCPEDTVCIQATRDTAICALSPPTQCAYSDLSRCEDDKHRLICFNGYWTIDFCSGGCVTGPNIYGTECL
jgi:hypothetical protein